MNMSNTDEVTQKNLGGRPLKFGTVDELRSQIDSYFAMCDPHIVKRLTDAGVNERGETIWVTREVMTEQRPYLISGLARALKTTRETLLDYESGKYDDRDKSAAENAKFSDTIREAKQRCEEYTEEQLYGPYSAGARFSLSNNFQGRHQPWSERQVVSGDPDAPLSNPMAALTTEQLMKLANSQDKPDGDTTSSQT